MVKTPVKVWVYKPWMAWRKNIYSDCLFDSKGRQYKEKKEEKPEPPYRKKDYQVEVPFIKS